MKKSIINKLIIAIILPISVILSIPYYLRAKEASRIVHSDDGWLVSSPAEQGIDHIAITGADKFISRTDAVSLIIVRHGAIVFENYYRGQRPGDLCFAYPAANSVLSALVGIAIGEGKIKDVHQRIVEYFPEQAEIIDESEKNEITIEHLLTMTSGLDRPEDDLFHTRDWIGNLLKLPLINKPGTKFLYSPKTTYLLSGIITKATGLSAAELSKSLLLEPIKAKGGVWHTGPERFNAGGEYLYLKPADIAKFGCLYLNNGEWHGRRIIPRQWVQDSLKVHVKSETQDISELGDSFAGYGYGFVARNIGGYQVFTTEGDCSLQSLVIVPELDMVVVVTTYRSIFKTTFEHKHLIALLQDYLFPAVREE